MYVLYKYVKCMFFVYTSDFNKDSSYLILSYLILSAPDVSCEPLEKVDC